MHDELQGLLGRNLRHFEEAGSPRQSVGSWFGAFRAGESNEDYRLHHEALTE